MNFVELITVLLLGSLAFASVLLGRFINRMSWLQHNATVEHYKNMENKFSELLDCARHRK